MSSELFEGFLKYPDTYDACERFWDSLVADIAEQYGPNDWHQWGSRAWGNGTPMREGNPMCDALSERLDRALRIIQVESDGAQHHVVAWMQHERERHLGFVPDEWPSDELVIVLSLSEETLAVARQLLNAWIDPAASVDQMNDLIARIAPPQR